MISIQLVQMYRALRRVTGGRHIQRPCIDFGTSTYRDFKCSRLDLSKSRLHDITYSINKDLTKFPLLNNVKFLFRNIAIDNRNKITMALNKLSIDKVELADKRVLMRYVFFPKTFIFCEKLHKNNIYILIILIKLNYKYNIIY
jgi:hypothetical protein